MLSDINKPFLLSVVMLNGVMLSFIMPNVVAPNLNVAILHRHLWQFKTIIFLHGCLMVTPLIHLRPV